MATNSSLFQERASEIRASAEVGMVVQIINGLVNEPSSKRFANTRGSRIERWQQLADVAQVQAAGLRAFAKAPARKRAAKAPAAPSTEVPITVASAT